jgi:hypothetical protein
MSRFPAAQAAGYAPAGNGEQPSAQFGVQAGGLAAGLGRVPRVDERAAGPYPDERDSARLDSGGGSQVRALGCRVTTTRRSASEAGTDMGLAQSGPDDLRVRPLARLELWILPR